MNGIFDTYIKATGGTAKWLLFVVLNLVEPIVNGICLFLTFFGGITFLIFVFVGFISPQGFSTMLGAHPGFSMRLPLFTGLGCAVVGMSIQVSYDIMMYRMFSDRIFPDEGQDEIFSRWVQLRNWLGVLALFVGFSFAAYFYYPSRLAFAYAPFIGFAWWTAIGIALGVCRWIYRQGVGALLWDAKEAIVRRAGQVRRPIRKPKILNEADLQTAAANVVPIRNREEKMASGA